MIDLQSHIEINFADHDSTQRGVQALGDHISVLHDVAARDGRRIG